MIKTNFSYKINDATWMKTQCIRPMQQLECVKHARCRAKHFLSIAFRYVISTTTKSARTPPI